mgnify:FL=1|tara:strand:+ start:510 stop:932 length:423 start_codon:yes stop_codon:yes gene_type:complete
MKGYNIIMPIEWRDWFSLRRRSTPRVSVNWMIDVEVPGSEPLHYVGLLARDLGTEGIRLEGSDVDRVRELLSDDGRVWMRLRLKGVSPPLPRVQAELCWGLGEKPHFMTGWRFTRIDSETIQLIESYVAEHQEDIIEEET